jgi:iron(III) transport system ATP-binding protein
VSPVVECRDLTKAFGAVRAVDRVGLSVQRGEVLALLGPSGCGKTTTLRLIAGFERPDAGSVVLAGEDVAGPGRFVPPERRRVGVVFQDYALFPHLTVAQNVGYGVRDRARRSGRVGEMLELVGLTAEAARLPHELSGGQQQRVAMARALAPEPALVLLDEPFSNLDAALRARVRAEVRAILREADATAVFVTHDQEEALSLADRVAVMWDGRVVQSASPETLYHRPVSRKIATFVGDAQFIPGVAAGHSVTCDLGTLPLVGSANGPVDVLVRPETVRLAPGREDTRENGTVIDRTFFGHDQLLVVRLDTGLTVQARLGSYGGFRAGNRVHVSVRGAVLPFSKE